MTTICQIPCVYMIYKPESQQYNIIFFIIAFELPTLSVISEENGNLVNMVYWSI